MTLAEQIAAVRKSIQDKQSKIEKMTGEALTKGVTPDEATESKIKALEEEISVLEKNLERLDKISKSQKNWAENTVPVDGGSEKGATETAKGNTKIEIVSNLEKGIGFAQYARAKLASQLEAKAGNYITSTEMAKRLGFCDEVIDLVEKATLGTTTNAGFAASLVSENRLVGEFVEMLRAATIFDKLKGYRPVPFNTEIPSQLTSGTASWVGEGAAKPLTNPTFGSVKIEQHKLAAITVYTQELMRRSDPSVDVLVRDDLIAAAATLIDSTFIGAQAASATSPIGILNSITAITAAGQTAADIDADLLLLFQSFLSNNLSLDGSYILMSETRAAKMALLRDALGNTYFNGMSLRGERSLGGVPVVVSETVGDKIILVKMSELLVAEDGGVDISYSDQATLVDGSTTHNLWQENKFAVRVEKFITWAKRRPVAAAYIQYS